MLKRSLNSAKAHISYSLRLILVMVIAGVCILLQNYMYSVLETYESSLYAEEGFRIDITTSDESEISETMESQITNLEGVSGCSSECKTEVEPVNFKNYTYIKVDSFDMPEVSNVKIVGTTCISFAKQFAIKNAVLDQETEIWLGDDQVVIDKRLADYNSLKIGNKISVRNDFGTVITLEIVGTYTMERDLEEAYEINGRSFLGVTPYSYLYCNWDTFQKIDPTVTRNYLSVFCADKNKITSVINEIQENMAEKWKLRIHSAVEDEFMLASTTMNTLRQSSLMVIGIITITVLLTLIVMIILYASKRKEDISVYVALGRPKHLIICEFLMEMLTYVGAALITLSLIAVVLHMFSQEIMQTILNFSGAEAELQSWGLKALETDISISDLLLAYSAIFAASLVTFGLVIIIIVRMKYKNLTTER